MIAEVANSFLFDEPVVTSIAKLTTPSLEGGRGVRDQETLIKVPIFIAFSCQLALLS
jgi:hypothetical protein